MWNFNMSYNSKGFTLLELIVTLAVAAIVLSMAIPSFTSSILNNNSIALGTEFNSALQFARSEAIKRSSRVSICPSANGETCLSASDWAKGWMVFVDLATSDAASSATIGTVLRFRGDIDRRAVVSVKKGTTAIKFVRFTSGGLLARENVADADPRDLEAHLTGCKGDAKYTLRIAFSGMTSAKKIACP